MKKVGLFGGSFDPIHQAHITVALKAIEQLQLDELWFIPTKNNPWKDQSRGSTKDRLQMIELAIMDYPNIHMNTIEIDSIHDEKNYTIDTIEKLKKEHNDIDFYYIMGMDQANLFYKWKDAKKISELVHLVAFQRGGYNKDEGMMKPYHFAILNNEPLTISSTDARNGHIEMLDSRVLKYITSHGLYLETLISNRMKEKRWKHTISVAHLASDIALANGLNPMQAYIAGMFHDVAKEMNDEDAHCIMQKYFPAYVNKPIAIWHQWVSRYVSEHEFLIDDPIVLNAIEHHTTGSVHISPIGKCVYVADKLDPLRGYDSSMQIEVCKKDIHQGFRNSLIDFYEFSQKKEDILMNVFMKFMNIL